MLISNDYGLTNDSKMFFLEEILSPKKVRQYFKQHLPSILSEYQLGQIKVIRYKPEKRCLIEFTFEGKNSLILIGKVRAKGTDFKSYNLQKQLWKNGFNNDCCDKISVPEPIGVIPQWQMWLQKKVPGKVLRDVFSPKMDSKIVQKIAQVAHKLHSANVPTFRSHLITDELAILEQKLPLILQSFPQWEDSVRDILNKCNYLGQLIPEDNSLCGIHRDFYFDQIIVNEDHFYLLDLDLYCLGNMALDIGNFIGHITEYSLRKYGDFNILKAQEKTLEDEFIRLVGEENREAVTIYMILTLVRHIYLSTLFPDRHFSTPTLLEYCETLLDNF
ncbi:MAG: phosphotransferase [Cyanobacterium sp.]